jgi:hypothetical protein
VNQVSLALLRVEAGAAEGFETLRPDRGTKNGGGGGDVERVLR